MAFQLSFIKLFNFKAVCENNKKKLKQQLEKVLIICIGDYNVGNKNRLLIDKH